MIARTWNGWAAIRKTEGNEWIDRESMSPLSYNAAELRANNCNQELGKNWAKNNPVVRIAKVEINEVVDYVPAGSSHTK